MLLSSGDSSIKTRLKPCRSLIVVIVAMAVTVTTPFDLVLEVYWALFDKEDILPQFVWQVCRELDEAAVDLLGRINDNLLASIVCSLKTRSLGQALREGEPPAADQTEINAVWWSLHRGHINADDF